MIPFACIVVVLLVGFGIYAVVREPKRKPMIKLEPPIIPPAKRYRAGHGVNRAASPYSNYQRSPEEELAYQRGMRDAAYAHEDAITDTVITSELMREMGNTMTTDTAESDFHGFGGGDAGGGGASSDWSAPDASSGCDASSSDSESSCDTGGGN